MKTKKEKGKLTPKKVAIIVIAICIFFFVPPIFISYAVEGNIDSYVIYMGLWMFVFWYVIMHMPILLKFW
jgi:hypothetical protein